MRMKVAAFLVNIRIVLCFDQICLHQCLPGNDNKGFEASETDPGSSSEKVKDESEKNKAKESEQEKKD